MSRNACVPIMVSAPGRFSTTTGCFHCLVSASASVRAATSTEMPGLNVAKMRKQLRDPLFTRTRDGFQPTPFGARLGSASCEALDTLLAGLSSSDQFDPLTTTRVFSFFMNDVGQTVFLPSLLKFLKQKAP